MLITRRQAAAGASAASVRLGARAWAAGAARPAQGQGAPLPLGALFPMTGEAALVGDESYRGLVLATDKLNGGGGLLGRTVALKRADAPDEGHAADAVKALASGAKVAAIFGTGVTSIALAASEAAGLAGVPYFELTATGAAVTGRTIPTVFRSCPQADTFGTLSVAGVTEVLAPLWRRSAASLRIAVLAASDRLGQAVAAAQAAACRQRGLTPAQTLSYAAGTVDFAPLVRPLKVAAIEVLLHTGDANDVVLLYRAMQQAGWRPRMVIGSGPGYAMADTRQAVGTALDGTMAADFPQYAVNAGQAPGAAAVAASYRAQYGAEPRSGLSLASYVGAGIFFAAIARAGSTDGTKLRAAVLASNVPGHTTANGWGAAFDASGQNRRACAMLMQWQGGRAVTVYPEAASVARAQGALAPLPPAGHTP
jgi:branched-chain amino acid transport system substrate-binding protein